MRRSLTGLLAMLLAACGSGSDVADPEATAKQGQSHLDQVPDAGPCDRLASAEWLVEPGCVGCTVSNAAAAADGSDQAASVTFPAAVQRTGGAAIRAHAPPGVVYEAGRVASVLAIGPGEMVQYDLYLRTYLGGVLQEEDGFRGTGRTFMPPEIITAFQTTKPFDAIEYYMNPLIAPDAVAEIVELCLDAT